MDLDALAARHHARENALSSGKLYGKPRIFNDLLSSQPLCFNLFGELTIDRELASAVVRGLTGGRFSAVHAIDFEHSPGRGDARYLGDRSAFDVFVHCRTPSGGSAFLGIEVKYHENLAGAAGKDRPRYGEVADLMGCFVDDCAPLKSSPLQQIWRDHSLLGCADRPRNSLPMADLGPADSWLRPSVVISLTQGRGERRSVVASDEPPSEFGGGVARGRCASS